MPVVSFPIHLRHPSLGWGYVSSAGRRRRTNRHTIVRRGTHDGAAQKQSPQHAFLCIADRQASAQRSISRTAVASRETYWEIYRLASISSCEGGRRRSVIVHTGLRVSLNMTRSYSRDYHKSELHIETTDGRIELSYTVIRTFGYLQR